MTRMYIQPSWIDAAADHNEWSGGNGQYRGDKSADIATFDKNGRARVEAFSDDAINARKESRKSSIPLKNKILPQVVRLETLTQQMRDLVAEYKQGIHTQDEYTLLMDVLVVKRDRAQVLLNKALSTKPVRPDDNETDDSFKETDAQNDDSCEDDATHSLDNNTSKLARMPNELAGFIVMSMVGFMGLLWLFN